MRTRRLLAALLGLTVAACEAFQPVNPYDPPYLPECWTPQEWIGQTCTELCDQGYADETGDTPGLACASGETCHDATAVGYKRYDACMDDQFAIPLEFGCDDPLPPELASSVYYVSCCCD